MGGGRGCLADGALLERVNALARLVKMEQKVHYDTECDDGAGGNRVFSRRKHCQHISNAAAAATAAAAAKALAAAMTTTAQQQQLGNGNKQREARDV
jgi:hypothetical protein